MRLQGMLSELQSRPTWRWTGRVVQASGQTVESEGPPCSVGECCEVLGAGGERFPAEVIGFKGRRVLAMPLDTTTGIQYGDGLRATGRRPAMGIGNDMLGRVLDARGLAWTEDRSLGWMLSGHWRVRCRRPWSESRSSSRWDGRAHDRWIAYCWSRTKGGNLWRLGRREKYPDRHDDTGYGGRSYDRRPGGERGREVREFVQDSLGGEGLARSVVIVSTSDQSPLLRMRAAQAATTIAEYHARRGKHVLLVLDSLTRYAMAARELGLAAGEPPASKGYTPSVFSLLAKLVERAGNLSSEFGEGSITAFYTVLMEGDDEQDPIVDAVRSFLDGHIVLSRTLASAGQYPPIDVLRSLSRLMPAVTSAPHREKAAVVRQLLSTYARNEDLIRIGAYKPGTDRELDRASLAMPLLRSYMQQGASDRVSFADAVGRLAGLAI